MGSGGPSHTIEGNVRRYDGLTDGRWTIGKYIYKYRLEISGEFTDTNTVLIRESPR